MSLHTESVYLQHMRDACAKVARYVAALEWAHFQEDERTQDAVIRCLEIIGEAGAKVTSAYRQAHPEIPWRVIIDLRNVLIHGYAEVRLDLVWKIATEDVVTLQNQLEGLLGSS
jgi:uncharacterized protein with HEPN domain